MHDQNCFITLTYDDENLPSDLSLHHSHFQKFMKRLRKRVNAKDEANHNKQILYYMCGEYGENFGRPHFHACLFNIDFSDKVPATRTGSGNIIYNSKLLESLWPYGFSSIGDLTFESAAYVARYVMKKITGDAADDHYRRVNPETGEIYWLTPEYAAMSNRRAIGSTWLEKYKTDVYPHDHVIINGFPAKPPRAYDKIYDKSDYLAFDDIKLKRELDRLKFSVDNTPERLAVREKLNDIKLQKLKRKL